MKYFENLMRLSSFGTLSLLILIKLSTYVLCVIALISLLLNVYLYNKLKTNTQDIINTKSHINHSTMVNSSDLLTQEKNISLILIIRTLTICWLLTTLF